MARTMVGQMGPDAPDDYTCKHCQKSGFTDRGLTYHVAHDCDEAPEPDKEDARRRFKTMRL